MHKERTEVLRVALAREGAIANLARIKDKKFIAKTKVFQCLRDAFEAYHSKI